MKTLKDLTVGIVGFGRIGREVADRLRGFKARVLVFDPAVAAADIEAKGALGVTLEELLKQSDIVSLHCPSTAETKKLLRDETIAIMKQGAVVVNLARGDLIETAALVKALQTGKLSAAALDVCDPEPIPLDSPLRSLPNVITASHIASASVKAVAKLRNSAAKHAANALQGLPLTHVVNGVV
jgi:phosphoglycerate dehydrogenase-like enzyme